jgi:hypothetical protein
MARKIQNSKGKVLSLQIIKIRMNVLNNYR